MVASLSLSPSVGSERFVPTTLTGAGLSNATDYIVTYTDPQGATRRIEVTTDGSGGFTSVLTPQWRGSYAIEIRPKTEWTGTTTAAATATYKVA